MSEVVKEKVVEIEADLDKSLWCEVCQRGVKRGKVGDTCFYCLQNIEPNPGILKTANQAMADKLEWANAVKKANNKNTVKPYKGVEELEKEIRDELKDFKTTLKAEMMKEIKEEAINEAKAEIKIEVESKPKTTSTKKLTLGKKSSGNSKNL